MMHLVITNPSTHMDPQALCPFWTFFHTLILITLYFYKFSIHNQSKCLTPHESNSKNPPPSNLSFTTHGVQSKLVLLVDTSPLNRSHKREQFDVGINLIDMNKIKCLIILWGHYSHSFVLGQACYHTPRACSKSS